MKCPKCEKEYSQPILPFHIKRCDEKNNDEENKNDYSNIVSNSLTSIKLPNEERMFMSANLLKKFPYDEITLDFTDYDSTTLDLENAFENWQFKNAPQITNFSDSRFTSVEVTTMFENSIVQEVPIYDTSKITRFNNMFQGCNCLSMESLDNILQMCINSGVENGSEEYEQGFKALSALGIQTLDNKYIKFAPRDVTPTEIDITTLPHYQDFIDAGWTLI